MADGGAGDEFLYDVSLTVNSTRNTRWDTDECLLGFVGTNAHTFTFTASDFGAVLAGYTDNFAWGTLSVQGTLSLFDANSATSPGGAQYVGILLGAAISGDSVTNITGNGLNIYYLPSLAENGYLGGKTYSLNGSGSLIPIASESPVPVPAAVWLFASGLVGLIGFRRRARG